MMTCYDKIREILHNFSEQELHEMNEELFNITKKKLLDKFDEQWVFRFFATKYKLKYMLRAHSFSENSFSNNTSEIKSYVFVIITGKTEKYLFHANHDGSVKCDYFNLNEFVDYIDIKYRKIKITNILNER